ncbi:helix-turn-helix domain-containing protein [Rossellomorea aquimaris]|uniref:helix-turn-helix domain-containing protein n=1 Tax=Rossellomorea aquimaris TaxID=189382 RepID=UPI001CD6CFD4|nr:helix-turn-helix transcriptional regulator [Rossellomorea aquimaris]MCA1055420.1 helix-turn-helix domain-containing protein [Rossellomorea aquimaris]
MNTGTLIKYCRIFRGMTQKDISEGICTPGHISRIESGEHVVSNEMIMKVGKKLKMDIETMQRSYRKWQMELELWLDVMVKEITGEIELLREIIEQNQLIQIETINGTYKLLKARYWIMKGNLPEAESYLKQFLNKRIAFYMSSFDYQLYYHVRGMLELSKGNSRKALEWLGKIDEEEYPIKEYYLHLSYAYHESNKNDLASQSIEISLNYFQETNNFSRMMDASILQLQAEGKQGNQDLATVEKKYDRLLQRCEQLQDDKRKAMLYINLGEEYAFYEEYQLAEDSYIKSYQLLKANPDSVDYLESILGVVESSILLDEHREKERNLGMVNEGIYFAEKIRDAYRLTLLRMVKRRLTEGEYAYIQFIKDIVIPLLTKEGRYAESDKYMKEVSNYMKTNGCPAPKMAVY